MTTPASIFDLKTVPAASPGHTYSEPAADSGWITAVQSAVHKARETLVSQQHADGHWVYELEADCTIPAEYILMNHFMNEVDDVLERKIANYLRDKQAEHGGWPLFHGGDFDLSCSIKAYYALKLAGDDPNEPHMIKARHAILAHGGAARANVFTRITLALFEQVPWHAVPFIPAEVILLPKWFPFHISKVSYWSRTVMVPLFVLCTLKPKAANPRGVDIRELFVVPPEDVLDYFHPTTTLARTFLWLDKFGRGLEKLVPKFMRRVALRRCEKWFLERLNGTDGLGGIFPAMVNSYESLSLLGYPADHPLRVQVKTAIKKLLVPHQHTVYCQPCVSPVWDTGLAAHALFEADEQKTGPALDQALAWLQGKQLSNEPGDWQRNYPKLKGGGWAFQYNNPHYPDLDDTSMVGWLMHAVDHQHYQENIERAVNWIHGMQSENGGFASFDADNTNYYLNAIPFADHGALLDPPTEDVTARCIALLAITNRPEMHDSLARAISFVKKTQEQDGSWYGRWGTNYIYGTWSVLSALEVAGEDMSQPYIQHAVKWLENMQNSDGGWGEGNESYYPPKHRRPHPSTPFQTAWALLGLFSAGVKDSPAIRRSIAYLLKKQLHNGLWDDPHYTAPGFPRVFYLKYHGYTKYFPLWALARYRNLNPAS